MSNSDLRPMRGAIAVLLFMPLAAADFQLNLLITRETRGAVYPVNRWGNQCSGPMPPPPPPPLSPDEASGEAPPAPPLAPSCSCTGGAARRRTLIGAGAAAAGAAENAITPSNVVSLDTGAFFSGSGKFFSAFGGNASSEFFAENAYDGYALTYRDFAAGDGPTTLARYLQRARSLQPALPKAVVTNFNSTAETVLSPYIEPNGYTLVPLAGGRTLAVLAVADPTHLRATFPDYASRLTDFWPPVARALASLRRLPQPPDVIALLISAITVTSAEIAAAGGSSYTANIAKLNRLVDDAIGVDVRSPSNFSTSFGLRTSAPLSKSNSLRTHLSPHALHRPALASRVAQVVVMGLNLGGSLDLAPHVRRNHAGDDVLIVPAQGATHGETIENVTVTFSDSGLLRGALSSSDTISLDCTFSEDAATATRVAELYTIMDQTLGVTIGYIGRALDSHTSAVAGVADADGVVPAGCTTFTNGEIACGCRVAACLQGAFVADALQSMTGADMAIANGGAIKSTLSRPAGTDGYVPVSTGDLIEMLPFANEVCSTGPPPLALLHRASTSGPPPAVPLKSVHLRLSLVWIGGQDLDERPRAPPRPAERHLAPRPRRRAHEPQRALPAGVAHPRIRLVLQGGCPHPRASVHGRGRRAPRAQRHAHVHRRVQRLPTWWGGRL